MCVLRAAPDSLGSRCGAPDITPRSANPQGPAQRGVAPPNAARYERSDGGGRDVMVGGSSVTIGLNRLPTVATNSLRCAGVLRETFAVRRIRSSQESCCEILAIEFA